MVHQAETDITMKIITLMLATRDKMFTELQINTVKPMLSMVNSLKNAVLLMIMGF